MSIVFYSTSLLVIPVIYNKLMSAIFDLQFKYKLDNDNNLLNSLISLCIIAL